MRSSTFLFQVVKKIIHFLLYESNVDRRMFGDEVLGAINIRMIETARSVGAAAKFTGSGGAVVAFCPEGPAQAELLEDACQKAGFVILPVIVAPSVLREEDLETLSSS